MSDDSTSYTKILEIKKTALSLRKESYDFTPILLSQML